MKLTMFAITSQPPEKNASVNHKKSEILSRDDQNNF